MSSKLKITMVLLVAAVIAWVSVEALPRQQEDPLEAPGMNPNVADCTFFPGHERLYVANPTRERGLISARLKEVSPALPQTGEFFAPAPKNFIDSYIFDRMARDGVSSAGLSSDSEFLRRVYLDASGRVPTPETVANFLNDNSAGKRDRVIDSLLGTTEYFDRWSNFIGDLVQIVANSTQINVFPDARNAYYSFVRTSIAQNKPYDQFVRELISGAGDNRQSQAGAANFFVRWRQLNGPIQDTYDNLAAAVGAQFLGLNLNCVSCHDGAGHTNAINLYLTEQTRYDLWELAAFFAKTAMINPYRDPNFNNNVTGYTVVDNPAMAGYVLNTTTGNKTPRQGSRPNEVVPPKYIVDGSSSDDRGPNASENYRAALARMLTSDRQFARATVNYVWKELFGLGMVEPADNFDLRRISAKSKLPEGWTLQATHPELLEALAEAFELNNYDLQYLIGTIMKSATYQLSSSYPGNWSDAYVPYFARKFPRRLKAEEMHDVILQVTNVLPNPPYTVAGTNPAPAVWAMQLPDTSEPSGRAGQLNGQARAFLDTFIRGNRDDRPRSDEGSISQALALLNNTFVTTRVRTSNSSSTAAQLFANRSVGTSGVINQLYLATLSRLPTKDEFDKSSAYLGNPITSQKLEDLQFALMNKVDFIFNY